MERVSLVDVSEPSVPGIGNSLGMTVGNPRHNKRDDEMETGLSLSCVPKNPLDCTEELPRP